ncbi:antibiotic biosynthesis monooxygenase [Nocardioides panacisoli]|uniref:antibiotic biosynthesis monooxygenase family protein n=1 Tax=Nocardioides panacisoli TaxID=627624 RepID=UPI001C62A9CF|nr:antibiotic biosynthesis monooxygenase [Nocardioides panacisoli]QYJ05515.1 antibiotic biosynthesis monooxygenase [Nocardioides panacisoli]
MLVVNRFREAGDATALAEELTDVRAVLARQAGYVEGWVGRNVDEPDLWVLTTRWEHVGAYRRALSAYEVKMEAWATLGRALDEPGAYEVVEPDTVLNVASPRVT